MGRSAAAVAVPGDGRHGGGAADRHAQPRDDRRTRRPLLDRRADAGAAAAVRAAAHADRLPLRPSSLGAGLAARALHLVRHDGCSSAVSRSCRSRCCCCRATPPARCGSGRPPRRSPSCWSAPACTRCRPSASRSPPISRRSARDPRVVALLCAHAAVGMAVSAFVFGLSLRHFSEVRLIQVVQGAALHDDGPQCVRALEAGAAQLLRRPSEPRRAGFLRGLARCSPTKRARGGAWSPSRSARRASACRTSCSSPMAARSCICPSARPPR